MLLSIDAGRQQGLASGVPTTTDLQGHVQQILQSKTFRRARRLRDLLAYVASNTLAGYASLEGKTARELYGKGEEFDPVIDPSIRVQFGRLRRLLHRYYQSEGSHDDVQIEIPPGSYTPIFKGKQAEADSKPAPKPDGQPRSVAVLPFTNLTNDPKQDAFCHGVTDEIVTALANAPDVDVVASASGLQFKDENADVRTVGRELGVPFILAGSVRKEGAHTRVTAQLARAADGVAIWSDTIDTHTKGSLDTQRSIAQHVIGNLPLAN